MLRVRQTRKTPSLDYTQHKIDDLSIIVCMISKQQSNNDNKQLLIDNCYVCVLSSF